MAIKLVFFIFSVMFLGNDLVSQELTTFSWQLINDGSGATGRHECAFVEYKSKFYLIGGRGVNPVNVFDPKTGEWSTQDQSPVEIHHAQPIVYGNAIYILGAMTGSYPREVPLENIWIYYPESDQWEKGPLIPEDRRRGGAGAVVYRDKFFLIGGIDYGHTSGTNNLFDCFDPKTKSWTTLTKAPTIRDHFSSVVVNEKLYCIGGRNTSYHEPDNFSAFFGATNPFIDVYDFEKEEWKTLAQRLPIPTAAAGVVAVGNKILYVGGESNQPLAHGNTQLFNTVTKEWQELEPLITGRHGSGIIFWGGAIYIAAGSPKRGGGNIGSVEKFYVK